MKGDEKAPNAVVWFDTFLPVSLLFIYKFGQDGIQAVNKESSVNEPGQNISVDNHNFEVLQ